MRFLMACILMLSFAASAEPNACPKFNGAVASGSASARLKKFIDTQWKYLMTEYPEWATWVGYPGQNGRWTDRSQAAVARRKRETVCQREALRKIDRRTLKNQDLVNYDLLMQRLDRSIESDKFGSDYLVLDHLGGVHTEIPETLESMPSRTADDLENMLRRLESSPRVIEQTEMWMREGLKQKITPVRMFLEKVPPQFDALLTAKIEESPLYRPFQDLRGDYDEATKEMVRARAKEILKASVVPALTKLREFLVKEYIPNARQSIAWKEMPNGEAWYAFEAKRHTTTNLTPKELHELGMKEVERIAKEMAAIREKVKFKGDTAAFHKFLLTDKRFYYSDKEELMRGYRDIAKRVDPELPKLFRTLPRLPYGVREVPEYKAKDAPAAYYQSGSLTGGRAGWFEANTYDLKARPKWAMEALTIHEAVPGHHLQIALAQEIEGMPEFRRFAGYTAFSEGWGLYAESLGHEMGFYTDPYSHYGQLSYEMWRAVRLVVDTGIHQFGWTRDRAIEFMSAQLPKSRLEVEVEIDRYITWPGQALAYKVGELKFRELRDRARIQLGQSFDVREFHDEVLKNGALPMDVLEKSVERWLEQKRVKKTDNRKESPHA